MKKILFLFVITLILVSAVSIALANEKDIERVDIIHYLAPKSMESHRDAKSQICYKLLGIKWGTLPITYTINPTNPQNLSEEFVTYAISSSAETWDNATSSELFNDSYIINYDAQYGIKNNENAIVFGDYPNDNVIAITSYWYNTKTKKILEFDILFNTRFLWGDATKNSSLMDLQNIATHELGHGIGMNDVYRTACSEVTMYGYSSYGETKKRTLEQPDIIGLQKMYG
ncbi:MAG: matrixin family metalloprotease [Candidatus Pacearchaeota archaeon]